jgi:hypothetical protein
MRRDSYALGNVKAKDAEPHNGEHQGGMIPHCRQSSQEYRAHEKIPDEPEVAHQLDCAHTSDDLTANKTENERDLVRSGDQSHHDVAGAESQGVEHDDVSRQEVERDDIEEAEPVVVGHTASSRCVPCEHDAPDCR